jgi:hypothetical protein
VGRLRWPGTPRIATAALACVLGAACGPVTFVDPDAEAKARLQLEGVEQLVVREDPRIYLHLRFATRTATAGTALVGLTAEGTFQVPWSAAARSDCGPSRTCLALTLSPGLPAPEALALLAPALGHRQEVPVVRRELEGYLLEAEARELNQAVQVSLLDPIRRYFGETGAGTGTVATSLPFVRPFEAHVAPGACGAPPEPADPGWTRLRTLPAVVETRFSPGPEPLACAWVRPAIPARGPPIGARTVGARAEVYRFRHVYSPPVERAPLVFLPLFDLEIPNPARCAEAEGLVQAAVVDAAAQISARTGAPVLALDPYELAEVDQVACRQANDRAFSAELVVRRAAEAIEAAFGPQPVRILWIYVQNLDLLLPEGLERAFIQLRAVVRSTTPHADFLFALAPGRVQDQLQADRHLEWVATEEPLFRSSIRGLLEGLWPFTTVRHDRDAVISMVPRGEAGRFIAYRVCRSSDAVEPTGAPLGASTARVPDAGGPGFTVALPDQWLIPASDVLRPTVVVEWEGCAAYCERPAPGQDPWLPWLDAPGC